MSILISILRFFATFVKTGQLLSVFYGPIGRCYAQILHA